MQGFALRRGLCNYVADQVWSGSPSLGFSTILPVTHRHRINHRGYEEFEREAVGHLGALRCANAFVRLPHEPDASDVLMSARTQPSMARIARTPQVAC
jgi:hypothetical protein